MLHQVYTSNIIPGSVKEVAYYLFSRDAASVDNHTRVQRKLKQDVTTGFYVHVFKVALKWGREEDEDN
jgi:hypothetical protein